MSDIELQTTFTETNLVEADSVEDMSLFGDGEVAVAGLNIRSVKAGVANFNLQGSRWHTFAFDIYLGYRPSAAVVSLGLMNIYNQSKAVNMQYHLGGYSISYTNTGARVTGRIFVGDTDGYLFGLSYMCIAI